MRMLFAVLSCACLNTLYCLSAMLCGSSLSSSSNSRSSALLKFRSPSRTSAALIISMTIVKFCSHTGALCFRYKMSACRSAVSARSQNGSEFFASLGVVFATRFVTSLSASLSLRR